MVPLPPVGSTLRPRKRTAGSVLVTLMSALDVWKSWPPYSAWLRKVRSPTKVPSYLLIWGPCLRAASSADAGVVGGRVVTEARTATASKRAGGRMGAVFLRVA